MKQKHKLSTLDLLKYRQELNLDVRISSLIDFYEALLLMPEEPYPGQDLDYFIPFPIEKYTRCIDRKYILRRIGTNLPMANSNGDCQEHRLVMANKIGRYLSREEVVHHIDHNTLNNSPDNLWLFSSTSEHTKFHQAEDAFYRKIINEVLGVPKSDLFHHILEEL